jgi:glycosyltransferase involved in cell wall biosynthesis
MTDARRARRISESTFAIVANGAPDSPPASGVRDYLLDQEARRVTTVVHPLNPEDDPVRRITVYEHGRRTRERTIRLPARPPATYAFDPLIPAWPARVDCWLGFNNLAAARGLAQRALGRADTVVYWAVDFVPNRFGEGLLTRVYDRLDAMSCRRADLRVEVSAAALAGRNERHGLGADAAPATVAPIGTWVDRTPAAPLDGWSGRRIIFLGHLVPRQGVGKLIEALELLAARGVEFEAQIAGRGPVEDELRASVAKGGLDGRVRFVGFLSDHREVEAFVAGASVAVAPYDTEVESFTRYADPSKLRSYAAAGLPIVLTDVPPNAGELAAEAGAEVVLFTAEGLADGLERVLASPEDWQRRRKRALEYSKRFDWEVIVPEALEKVGFRP